MSRPRPVRSRFAAAALAGVTMFGAFAPQAIAADPSARSAASRQAHHEKLLVGRTGVSAAADLTPATVLSQINSSRLRYGVGMVTMDTSITAALNAHARYITLNAASDDDLSTEETSAAGYTAAGAEIAPYVTAQQSSTWAGALAGWMSDPYFRDVELLDQTISSIGFGQDGAVKVYASASTGEAPTGYPRVYPNGAGNNELTNGAPWLAADYNCSGTGFPITAMWDYMTYGQATQVTGTLYADGNVVPTCAASIAPLASAQGALVPATPLKAGTHYTGQITATLEVLAGGRQTVTQQIDFTTGAKATFVPGDQTGDGAADLFATNANGELWFFKGSKTGAYGHAWKVGHGWGSFNWLSLAGDINKDGRSDLLARRNDGAMFLYYSDGMGRLRSGGQVGYGFQTLDLLTVVGDMNNDGVRDLVGRTGEAKLRRYNLGATITGSVEIGHGWGAMTHLIGEGSFNGDVYDDLIGIASDGKLYGYYTGPKGNIVSQAQVGNGWAGWNALFVPGDHQGDGLLDMTGRNAAGELYSYRRVGNSWDTRVKAGSAFGTYRLFA